LSSFNDVGLTSLFWTGRSQQVCHFILYVATVGAIDLRDDTGKLLGEVVYTAYTVPGAVTFSRPVTFAVNGGPAASGRSTKPGWFPG
jgi:carboxypeptidase C (cathepsin A)